jgi:outer membrane protein assembly factor BamC
MMKTTFLVAAAVLALAGCSTTFDSNKVDYKSQGKAAPTLEVPPDLSQLTKNAHSAVPTGGAANASAYANAGVAKAEATAPSVTNVTAAALGDVQVQREGTQRWLVVARAPDVLWSDVKTFWMESGFTIAMDQPNLGIMETEWNENRAKLPQDGFRKLLGKVLDGLYSTNERDKFRTRMERTANGGTEIYITHRGVVQDYVDSARTNLQWKSRPSDPELEVEFLKRLMVRLGAAPEAAKVALDKPAAVIATTTAGAAPVAGAASVADSRARIATEDGQVSLLLNEAFDPAWRKLGLSLDRTNFTVEDRDRSKGIYFVRYVEADAEKNAPGFFARLFGEKAKEPLQKYQIVVKADATRTRVWVATAAGQLLGTADAKTILKVLADDLQ